MCSSDLLAKYNAQGRAGRGVRTMDITSKTGNIVDAVVVEPEDKLMVLTENGVAIRTSIAEIRATGRSTQGVKLINLNDGDKVATIERILNTAEVEDQLNGAS